MKRSKEDMLETKEQVLNSAFDCFFEYGYEKTSLVEIAERAGVTRGAVYWHFTDKKDLYRASVELTMEKGDVAKYAKNLSPKLSIVERLETVFNMALTDNRYVDFVFKTMSYIAGREEFDDIYQKLRDVKRDLLNFFDSEVSYYIRSHGMEGKNADDYTLGLYFLFEGMFLSKNVPIGVTLNEDRIHFYIRQVLESLLVDEDK